MKLTLEKSVFQKALSHAHSVVERKTALPILSHVLMQAEGMNLRLTSTDLELSIVETISATVQEPGKTTVPVHLLYEIVRKCGDGSQIQIVHDRDSHQLEITSGNSNFKLPCLPSEDFPVINKDALPFSFNLTTRDLKVLIERTRIAMSTEETRYFLNGIYFHVHEDEFRAVATDGHRLAKASCPVPEGASGMPGVIVSRKTVNEIYKILTDSTDDITVSVSPTQISFNVQGMMLTSRLVDGQYPDYNEAIPAHLSQTMNFKVKPFSQAVDRVATISNERFSEIKLTLDTNRIQFSAANDDSGRADEELEVMYDGQSIDIGFNSRYLMDVAAQIDGDEATLELNDRDSSVIFRPVSGEKTLFVLMPLRL